MAARMAAREIHPDQDVAPLTADQAEQLVELLERLERDLADGRLNLEALRLALRPLVVRLPRDCHVDIKVEAAVLALEALTPAIAGARETLAGHAWAARQLNGLGDEGRRA